MLHHKLGGPQPTFINAAVQSQNYYAETLQGHIESIELLLDEGLSLPSDYGTELDTDTLLRMDPSARAEVLGRLVGAVLSPNEARYRENLPGVPGGESPLA